MSCGGTSWDQNILPLDGANAVVFGGDSITFGHDDTPVFNGFRYPMAQAIDADIVAGAIPNTLVLTYPGSVDTGAGSAAQTRFCEGTTGFTCEDLLARLPTYYGPGKLVPTAAIFWLLIGINNCVSETLFQSGLTAYPQLLTTFNSLTGCTRFGVSLIRPTAGRLDLAIRWNAALPGIWDTIEASNPTFQLVRVSENIDGFLLHPDHTQFATLAACWHAPFRKLLGYPL